MANILLVDDERVARTLYGDFLVSVGHQVTAAASAEEALAALAAAKFDLILTDLRLPEVDGMHLLQATKTTYPDIPVIVITAVDKVWPALHAIKIGASDYLIKPIMPEILSHAVERALTQRVLLTENAGLRQHVSLLEAGQRLAATLDRGAMLEAAAHAYRTIAGADAVAIFSLSEGMPTLAHVAGVAAPHSDSFVRTTVPVVQVELRSPKRSHRPVTIAGSGYPFTHFFPSPDADDKAARGQLGAVLTFYEGRPRQTAIETASYLTSHLALGFKNLDKFTKAEGMAYVDDLTKLRNRRYLELIIERELTNASISGTPFAILFLDLDHFKRINDAHGHSVGSRVLVEVGRVIATTLRANDTVVRWGGDEYLMLLRRARSEDGWKVAERIRCEIAEHSFLSRDGLNLRITACIGIASFPENAMDKSRLIDCADRAMYCAKRGTRNATYSAGDAGEIGSSAAEAEGEAPKAHSLEFQNP